MDNNDKKWNDVFWNSFCMGMAGCLLGIFVTQSINDHKPSAMDVYEGKTTLEYTTVDGVRIDSAVIYKPTNK